MCELPRLLQGSPAAHYKNIPKMTRRVKPFEWFVSFEDMKEGAGINPPSEPENDSGNATGEKGQDAVLAHKDTT